MSKKWQRVRVWDRPLRVNTRRKCEVMDQDGRQCNQTGKWLSHVHGNEWDTRWYAVTFCDEHVKERVA